MIKLGHVLDDERNNTLYVLWAKAFQSNPQMEPKEPKKSKCDQQDTNTT